MLRYVTIRRMTPTHRIGIDARLIAYREGGIAEYTRRLIEALWLLDKENNYEILYHASAAPQYASDRSLLPKSRENFHYTRTFTPCHHRLERLALGAEVSRLQLDLLHSPDFIPPIFGARRMVITIHDLNFLYYPQFQTPDSHRYYNGQIRAAVQKADHILVDSQATKADVINLLSVPPEKITVHLLGVDPAFRPLPTDIVNKLRSRCGLPESYILFVGTFEPRKNIPGLLDAYVLLQQRLPDAPPLVIAGRRGWLYESIFQKVTALGLEKRVIFLEDVPPADLPTLYNGAGVLVLPSFYEGFGFPPLEAMACGVPTVVADRASLPEVVGDVGMLIDPDKPESIADGLYSTLTDSALRERSRREGLTRAATFTWRRTAEIALGVYDKMLAEK